ncbi:MAG: HlyC/CorC family transporter [Lachnospiraceae bacterium]|nr:HlyC/CorC family transporter [Lachnospiraceae bacterium]
MDTTDIVQLICIVLLLVLSAFFSSAETALSTVNKVRIRSLAEEGNKKAIKVTKILDNYGKMLSTILIGNNIVNISASSLVTSLVIDILGNAYVGIATGVLTVMVLLFGEITPKNWANSNAEKISLAYSSIIFVLIKLFAPIIFIVDILSTGLMKLLRIDLSKKDVMTENELRTYVDESHKDGVIETEEKEIIYNVFDFSDAVAKDIMIPRINMVTVSIDASYEELLDIFRESMYTRIPVYKEDQDSIVGLVNVKDFILTTDTANFQISDIIRPAYYTYEFKKTADLMFEMREKTMNVSFVLNEYGATVGMITMEDLLEEIVGEIRDEYDQDEEQLIQEVETNVYLIEGSMKLDDINDALDTNLESEDYDSIAGIIIEALDRLPEDGEEVSLKNGIHLKVQGVEQNRIVNVLMTLPTPTDETSDEEETSDDE